MTTFLIATPDPDSGFVSIMNAGVVTLRQFDLHWRESDTRRTLVTMKDGRALMCETLTHATIRKAIATLEREAHA